MTDPIPLGESSLAGYLPTASGLLAFGGFGIAALVLVGLGGAAVGRRQPIEIQLVAGWGLVSILCTVWGVLTPWSLKPVVEVAALAAAGIVVLRRKWLGTGAGVAALALIALPLWLVMLPVAPSQIDSWLNLLPNAAYLADWGRFPTTDGPPSHSFLPGAPYNTQFIALMASVFSIGFAASAMSWFNILLSLAMALLLARLIAGGEDRPPSIIAVALGFLVAIPLNPAFVPRIAFAPYGETPLAATSALAAYLGSRFIAERQDGMPARDRLIALALVLSALINTKQSGLGLLAAICFGLLSVAVWRAPAGRRFDLAVPLLLAFLPALGLYALWRHFIAVSGADELKPLAFRDWNTGILPQILAAMAFAAWEKATLFLGLAAAVLLGVRAFARRDRGFAADIAMMAAGVIVAFNAYILLAYIAHFPAGWALQAHSYGRYNYQLGFLLMQTLLVSVAPITARWLDTLSAGTQWRLGYAAVGLVLVLPVATAPLLRFDRDAPQPVLRRLAAGVAVRIAPDQRLALLLPGDTDDTVASFLRGSLLFTEPRRSGLDFWIAQRGDAATLDAAAAAGFDMALVSCTPADLLGLPEGEAALLKHDSGGWSPVAEWQYPADLPARHWSAMLARGPVCGVKR